MGYIWNFCNNWANYWAKIGISDQISQQVLNQFLRATTYTYIRCIFITCTSISQEWLKLQLSNFVQRETISSLAKGMVLLTWPIFVCTTVDLEKIIHATLWTAIINIHLYSPLMVAWNWKEKKRKKENNNLTKSIMYNNSHNICISTMTESERQKYHTRKFING